jgi:hypothetical protein
MEDDFADRGQDLAVVGENQTSDEVDRRVLGVEADGFFNFGQGAGEVFELSAVTPIVPRIPRVFLPVKWDRRTYLIPREKLEEFCDAIIKGDEPRN